MATSVWRGHISFGLVSIPVRLFKAARAERVKLREVYTVTREPEPEPEPEEPVRKKGPTLVAPPVVHEERAAVAPVRRSAIDQSGEEIPASAVSKGYEIGKNEFVTLDREELRALAPKTSTTMELVEFVDLASVDPVYFETSYYVQPEEAGQKAYALLHRSLRETGLVGVAQIAMHRREHIVLVRSGHSGLIAHTMFFANEVRADQEYKADDSLVNAKELEMANTLVRALAAEFDPQKFRDTYREQVEKLIAAKMHGQEIHPAQQPAASRPAIDVMDALRKSLAGLKKPAEPAARAVSKTSRKRR
jgi:DNA end-binding protein Ku